MAEQGKNGIVTKAIGLLGNMRVVLALVAVLVVGFFYSPRDLHTGWPIFLTFDVQLSALYEISAVGLLAVGMTFVIITGGIDLSVGAVMGLVAMLFSIMYIKLGWSPAVAVCAAIAAGALCGLVNGLLVSKLRLQPFVATLATMAAARGAAQLTTHSESIVAGPDMAFAAGAEIPFFNWMNTMIFGSNLRVMTLWFLIAVVVGGLVLKYSRFGRQIYAIGGNEEAARLSGIPTARVKTMAYVISGVTAALAGICDAAKTGFGFPQAGFTLELDAIAAVVVGGTSLMGGRGSMFLTLIGAVLIADITKLLSINVVRPEVRLIAKGALILGAVLVQQRGGKKTKK